MVKVNEAEKIAILARLKELAKRKDELLHGIPKSTISYTSMNKNLSSTTKTYRKTQKVLQKV